MKILQLSEDFYPKTSGGAFTDWNFAKRAVARGHEVIVYTPRGTGESLSETECGVQIERPYRGPVANDHPNSLMGVLHRLRFFILLIAHLSTSENNLESDVIYSTNFMLHPVAKAISWRHDIPVVNFVAYSPSQNPSLSSLDPRIIAEKIILAVFTGRMVLCRTPATKRFVDRYTTVQTILIHGILNEAEIRYAAESNEYETRGDLWADRDENLVVSVGRFVAVKNVPAAVRVISMLPEGYRLSLIGDGEEKPSIRREAQYADVAERVQFCGERPHPETLAIISAADVLLLTSDVEAYPTVVFEALALDTPVVATSVGVLPKINHPDLHLSEVESMKAVVRTVTDGDFRQSVDEDVLNRYSMGEFTNSALAALRSVVATHSPSLMYHLFIIIAHTVKLSEP